MTKRKPKWAYRTIKNYHSEDRPREKLMLKGKHTLTKAELLGIIINTGIPNENSVDLARQILAKYDNNLSNIARLSVEELMHFKGIGKAKAATIVGTFELAKRLEGDYKIRRPIIKKAEDIYRLMRPKLSNKVVEEFWLVLLNMNHQVIRLSQISQGGLRSTMVDKQVVFRECLLHNAVSIAMVHNHPSGNTQPSIMDIHLTKSVLQGSLTLNITVIDHLIFGEKEYFSFADEGLIDSLLIDIKQEAKVGEAA